MRKNIVLPIAFLMAIAACNTKQSEEKTVNPVATAEADTAAAINKAQHFFWFSEYQAKDIVMVKARQLSEDSVSTSSIIQLMNDLYPEIQVQLDNISNDTAFVSIPNSTYLTQQTGSSGPQGYFAELTYNLTEVKTIQYVALKFKKGDHAEAGIFSRANFKQVQ